MHLDVRRRAGPVGDGRQLIGAVREAGRRRAPTPAPGRRAAWPRSDTRTSDCAWRSAASRLVRASASTASRSRAMPVAQRRRRRAAASAPAAPASRSRGCVSVGGCWTNGCPDRRQVRRVEGPDVVAHAASRTRPRASEQLDVRSAVRAPRRAPAPATARGRESTSSTASTGPYGREQHAQRLARPREPDVGRLQLALDGRQVLLRAHLVDGAADPAHQAGVRVVEVRLGAVARGLDAAISRCCATTVRYARAVDCATWRRTSDGAGLGDAPRALGAARSPPSRAPRRAAP